MKLLDRMQPTPGRVAKSLATFCFRELVRNHRTHTGQYKKIRHDLMLDASHYLSLSRKQVMHNIPSTYALGMALDNHTENFVEFSWRLIWEHCHPWPAISDIWLGVRTVPVLSVAKEVAAPARLPTGRGAPEQAGRDRYAD